MAAGRRGGYRGKEFEHHESDLGMLKKEIGDSNGYYGGMRNRNGEYERGQSRVRDGLDHGVRQKDIKEREQMNGGYLSSSSFSHSGSGGGSRRRGHSSRTIDREPGELSSDGSDGSFDSKIAVNKEIEFRNMDNGIHLSLVQNKRKFSPIVWDREDRVLSRPVNSKHITGTANLPPPPPPPLARSHQSSNSNPSTNADVQTSAPDDAASHIYEVPPSKINSLPDLPEIPVETSSSLPEERWVSKLGITAVDDNEDYMPTRTVITSRWENEADTDEGEISHHEDRWIKRRSVSELNGVRVKKKISPELVDVEREGSTGTRGRSSESDERVRSSSRDSYSDNDDKHVYMEISDGLKYVGASVSESDSEFEDDAPLPNRRVNMLQCCRSVTEFEYLNKIDEGTYGIVSRAKDTITGEIVALKKVKMEKEKDGFPLTSLREINILLSFNHPSIVDVKEVVMGESRTDIPDGICGDSIFMVMEYMEHDLKGLMETMKQPFSQSEVKCLMRQLLRGVKYLHDNWVLHRDLKTSNILFNNRGKLKICDFGLARQYGSPLKPYTQLVVTLWYRAPELLLGAKQYSTSIDMWSVGCIMAELLTKQPLFNGKSELDQLDKIFRVLGTPNETIWPGCTKLPGYKVNFVRHQYSQLRKKFPATSFTGSPVLSDTGFDLLTKLLTYDPEKRITAEAALNHKWFSEVPLPKSKKFMPTYPALHAQDRRLRRVWKSPDPLEEQRRKELQGEIGTGGLFGL